MLLGPGKSYSNTVTWTGKSLAVWYFLLFKALSLVLSEFKTFSRQDLTVSWLLRIFLKIQNFIWHFWEYKLLSGGKLQMIM